MTSTIDASFKNIIAGFAKKTNATVLDVHRGVSNKLFKAIIEETPVDTGEASGGWKASIGAPVGGATGMLGPAAAVAAMQQIVDMAPIDAKLYLSNSVAHIEGLEYGTHRYGFSPKAPKGMVRTNVADFRRFLSAAVAGVKK